MPETIYMTRKHGCQHRIIPYERYPSEKEKGGLLRGALPAKSDYCYEKNNKQ